MILKIDCFFDDLSMHYTKFGLCALRMVCGFMLLQHATTKLWQFPLSMTGGHGAVPLWSMLGASALLELAGGILLLLGLWVRLVAFILSGEMAVAYFFVHVHQAGIHTVLFPQMNGGELAVVYCFVFLYLCMAGGGAFALDNRGRQAEALPQ